MGGGKMSATGGSLPPIKRRNLYDAAPGPRRATGGVGTSGGPGHDDGWGRVGADRPSGGRSGRGRGRGSAQTPPARLIAVAAGIIPLTLWLGPVSRPGAVLVGMFVGVIVLGFTRLTINKRVSSGRYADWSVPAARVATALFVAGWAVGALSMWRLAIEFSRRFT